MCGIAGIISPNVKEYQEPLMNMVNSLRHRGPDEMGTYCFQNCALGHTRLSIIDLKTGQQPMLTKNKWLGVTFNGEIYGYQELKSKLSGYPFQTTSDTEVILALYQTYGKKMVDHLPGMFAFAIWNEEKEELFCARDRFGEKPFYYAKGRNGEFIFASEIKSILASGLINPTISRKAMTHYLQRLYVHPYATIYENIYVLPPAHTLSCKEGSFQVKRYWLLPEMNKEIEMDEAVEQFQILLDQAVKRQLVADVPVAAFLSGGLDSSSIVAVASRYHSDIKTMSFGFDEDLSELPFARDVKNLYKTDHVELTARDADIGELLLKMAEVYDEPFADSSNIPTYLISKLARGHAKVVLTGDGGDELFGGYADWYKSLHLMELEPNFSTVRFILMRLVAKSLAVVRVPSAQAWKEKGDGLFFRRKYGNISQMHEQQNIYFKNDEISELGLEANNGFSTGSSSQKSGTLDDALRMDLQDYMPGDILTKIDRASMANGLELRAPFLDIDFSSFCISLPSRLKVTSREDKSILRKACSDLWPESVRKRSKRGFGAPVEKWLKEKSVCALKEEYLNDRTKKMFNMISFEKSQMILKQDNYQTWILLVLSLWMERQEF